MRRLFTLGVLFCALPGAARAEPYWVAWEGNDYPETDGWERFHYGDDGLPAARTLSEGAMTLNGLASIEIIDSYQISRLLNPGLGEQFVMQWRVRVEEIIGNPAFLYDPGLNIFSDDDWALTFHLGTDRIRSVHENVLIPFEAGAFHAFEVRSFDMRDYVLSIDGTVAHSGTWWEPTFRQSSISWGDFLFGAASQSSWDYFRFGVVPEPAASVLLGSACLLMTLTFRKRRHS